MKVVVAMTGATGAILGIRLLQALKDTAVETHLVLTDWAEATITMETDYHPHEVRQMATEWYPVNNLAAPLSSGSFRTDGMVVIPCSMRTLASIRMGLDDNLVVRAAGIALKERRKLILVPREAPLSDIHLENMQMVSRAGAIMIPPMLEFYTRPTTLDDVINHVVARVLDQFGIDHSLSPRWEGKKMIQSPKVVVKPQQVQGGQ